MDLLEQHDLVALIGTSASVHAPLGADRTLT